MVRLLCAICLCAVTLTAHPGCRSVPGQENFFSAKQRLDAAARSPKVGALASEFQQMLAATPGDPALLYLYGRSLMGKDTKQAIAHLNRAAALAPELPWTYAALAEIYASRVFRDDARALDNMRSFRRLCPGEIEAYRFLDRILDPAEAADWAAGLRELLETRLNPDDGRLWMALWAAEFRAMPLAAYPRQRQLVAADVRRIQPLAASSRRDILAALHDGFKLSGQAEAAERLFRRLNPDLEVRKEYDVFIDKAGVRARALKQEDLDAFNAEYAKAAAEWVKRWPDSPWAWELRAMTLSSSNSPPDELEKAGLEVLRLDTVQGGPWTYVPRKLRVAQYWLRKGVRPADCVRMAEEALAQIRLGPADPNDMTGAAGASVFPYDSTLWDAMIAVVEGAVQLRDFAKADAMVAQMQRWVDDNRSKQSDSSTGYDRFRGRFFHSAGVVQEAQGHKLDALALYLAALAIPGFRFPGEEQHARQLWNETGGSPEVWVTLTRRPPPASAATPAAKASPTAITTASTFAAWTDLGKPLPSPNLRDTTGRTWTIADFRGKTTFLNVWATWCFPCWDELPQIQKLHETIKGRTDLQIVTISVDENPGEVEPFAASRGLTFPVLLVGRPYVEAFIGPLSIPRNWIIDTSGTVRQQSVGFDAKVPNWPGEILKRLEGK